MYNIGFPKERCREFLIVTFVQNIADQIKKQFSRGFLLLTLFTKMSHATKHYVPNFQLVKKYSINGNCLYLLFIVHIDTTFIYLGSTSQTFEKWPLGICNIK